MDIFSHALWASAAATAASNAKQRPVRVGWTAWWGVFPDLFAFVPMFAIGAWTQYRELGTLFSSDGRSFLPFDTAWQLYQISHSLVVFILAFLVVLLVRKAANWRQSWRASVPWAMLGWPLHILLDIPTHRLSFFATPFLWPVSDYRYPYGFSWAEPWFMLLNLVALCVAYAWLWRRHRPVMPAPSAS